MTSAGIATHDEARARAEVRLEDARRHHGQGSGGEGAPCRRAAEELDEREGLAFPIRRFLSAAETPS